MHTKRFNRVLLAMGLLLVASTCMPAPEGVSSGALVQAREIVHVAKAHRLHGSLSRGAYAAPEEHGTASDASLTSRDNEATADEEASEEDNLDEAEDWSEEDDNDDAEEESQAEAAAVEARAVTTKSKTTHKSTPTHTSAKTSKKATKTKAKPKATPKPKAKPKPKPKPKAPSKQPKHAGKSTWYYPAQGELQMFLLVLHSIVDSG